MRGEGLLEFAVDEGGIGGAGFLVFASGEFRFAGVKGEAGVKQPRARRRRRLFHHVFDDDERGAVFALLEKSGREAEAGGGGGAVDRERAFEERLGFGGGAAGEDDLGDVLEKRSVVGRDAEGGAELGRDGGRIERIVGHAAR